MSRYPVENSSFVRAGEAVALLKYRLSSCLGGGLVCSTKDCNAALVRAVEKRLCERTVRDHYPCRHRRHPNFFSLERTPVCGLKQPDLPATASLDHAQRDPVY